MEKAQLLQLIESLPVAVLLVDADGWVRHANAVAHAQLDLGAVAPPSVSALLDSSADDEDRVCFLPAAAPPRGGSASAPRRSGG